MKMNVYETRTAARHEMAFNCLPVLKTNRKDKVLTKIINFCCYIFPPDKFFPGPAPFPIRSFPAVFNDFLLSAAPGEIYSPGEMWAPAAASALWKAKQKLKIMRRKPEFPNLLILRSPKQK
jgi:hypothetical protein